MRHPDVRATAWPYQDAADLCSKVLLSCATLASFLALVSGAGLQAIPGSYLQSNYTTQPVTIAQVVRASQTTPLVPVAEATISGIHSAFLAKRLNCSQLVQSHVQRIMAYDQQSGLNSVRQLSPSLSDDAVQLDQQLSKVLSGQQTLPRLFCVPLLVKDNFDTVGMAATNGAVGLLDNYPSQDAHQVRLLKDAGAIVLGKSNMAEWAFSPGISIGSVHGVVRNPYATDYSSGGSSGGTAAGVAASFAVAGLGTDTGNSIRGPAGWNSLVGIRPSLGLSSRSGVIPLDATSDVAGPLARTVEDAVRVFEVTVGVDPSDNLTTLQTSFSIPSNYTQFLRADGLEGMRVGVMRQTIDAATADDAVLQLFEQALQDLGSAGATLVDNFTIRGNSLGSEDWGGDSTWFTGYGQSGKDEQLDCGARFKFDINVYLNASASKYKTIQALVAQGEYHPSSNASMMIRLGIPYLPSQYPPPQLKAQGFVCSCDQFYNDPCRSEFRARLLQSMDEAGVSVLVFPTWSNPPPLVGDYGAPDGNNSPQIAPPTGAPAMVVPMGFMVPAQLAAALPASLQFLARPFDEGAMIRAAYAYEQSTMRRRLPPAFPELRGSWSPSPAPAAAEHSARSPAGQEPGYNSLG